FDLTLIHAVAPANLDVGARPYSDGASDGASSHSLSEPLGEDHAASLRLSAQLREEARRGDDLPRTADARNSQKRRADAQWAHFASPPEVHMMRLRLCLA